MVDYSVDYELTLLHLNYAIQFCLYIKWVVTYDKEDFILDLYLKFRMYEYSLNYSAATVGKGQEYMIFSDNCIVPEKSSINFNKVITI